MDRVTPTALAVAIAALLVTALVAGLIPGRRAASIDPARALRTE
jgi:ABC-type lipoprotein release transport system permease subunit